MSDIKDFVINNGVLVKYIGKSGNVIIPFGVTVIGDGAFYNRESVTSVEIPLSVTSIDKWAFFRCKGLKSIVIPDSVTSIGEKAFSQCTSLVQIKLPCGITSIDNGTFEECKKLESILIPGGVREIGAHAFSGCSKLTSVTIPKEVISIGSCAFSECNSLADENGLIIVNGTLYGGYNCGENIIIPESVTNIDKWAFSYYFRPLSINFPHTIKSIGANAFKNSKIKRFVLPRNITEFDNSTLEIILNYFFGTEHKSLILDAFFDQVPFAVLKNHTVKRKIKASKNKIIEKAIKEDDSECISKLFELYEAINIDDLNNYIEKASSTINVRAFLLNYKNQKYTYEEQVQYENDKLNKELGLKKRTVAEWRKIYNLDVYNNQVTITGYKGTDTQVVIPETIGKYKVVAIGDFAFSPEASRLKKTLKEAREKIERIYIPDTVTEFGKGVFYRCAGLADDNGLVIVGGVLYSFHGPDNIVRIPDGVTTIDENAFGKGRRLIRITIPDTVTSIGEGVFSRCKRIAIYASEGSYAEQYAKEHNITFVAE